MQLPLKDIVAAPAPQRPGLVWRTLQMVATQLQPPAPGRADQIVPLVRAAPVTPEQMTEPLAGGLRVTYAFNHPTHFEPVRPADLARLELEPKRLREVALANLRRELPPFERRGHSGMWMLVNPATGGHYEASLLLLDEVWEQLAQAVSGELVAAVPAKDLLFVSGTGEAAALTRFKEISARAFGEVDGPLSGELLVRRGGNWHVWAA